MATSLDAPLVEVTFAELVAMSLAWQSGNVKVTWEAPKTSTIEAYITR